MQLIPAVDIKEGRCVRLYQGKYDRETVYGYDAVSMAEDFESRGAQRLHVIDLDGAVLEKSENFSIIESICRAVAIPVECGGGIRNLAAAKNFLDAGATDIILGTVVIGNPDEAKRIIKDCGAGRVQIGFDYSGERIAVRGWRELVRKSVVDEIRFWEKEGIARFILTDITRDGTLSGLGIESLLSVAEKVSAFITAAGGVSKPADIDALRKLEPLGVDRVISGKAVYEGTIRIEDYA